MEQEASRLAEKYGRSWPWVHLLLETIRQFGEQEWGRMKIIAQNLQGDQRVRPNEEWRSAVTQTAWEATTHGQLKFYLAAELDVMGMEAPSENARTILAELASTLTVWHTIQPPIMRNLLRSILPEQPFHLNGGANNPTQQLQTAAAIILDGSWEDADAAEELVGRELAQALLVTHMAGLEARAQRRATAA